MSGCWKSICRPACRWKELAGALAEKEPFNDNANETHSKTEKKPAGLERASRQIERGARDGVQALFLKDIYELLERVVDRCRDAGNVITHIVLKNS